MLHRRPCSLFDQFMDSWMMGEVKGSGVIGNEAVAIHKVALPRNKEISHQAEWGGGQAQ